MQLECPDCHSVVEMADGSSVCPSCGRAVLVDLSARNYSTAQLRDSSLSFLKSPAQTELLGRDDGRIGNFEMRRLIGTGGFSSVYLAYDPKLDRDVAIKLPKKEVFTKLESLGVFCAEARTAAKLKHPNIVHIYDVEVLDEGTCFIVMEYIEGMSLRSWIDQQRQAGKPVDLRFAAQLIAQVAEVVHYAHKSGLVHRDLKPQNILLDQKLQPHLADFGLALHESVQHHHEGEIAGTMPYMAPEQVRGEAHHLDGRCDIWALGVILYELITGRRPFISDSKSALKNVILQREPKPPRQIDDSIPAELERICLRCLSKPIAARYSTAQDLANDLHHWLNSAAVTVPVKPSRWRKYSGLAVALISIVLISVALSLALNRPSREDSPKALVEPNPPLYARFRDVDSLSKGKWQPLLDRPPLRFMWTDSAESVRKHDPLREILLTSCSTIGMLTVGRTEDESFRLQIMFTKPTRYGNEGVFFGARPTVKDGEPKWIAQTIFVQCDEESGTSVRRQEIRFAIYDHGLGIESQREFGSVNVDPLTTGEQILQVTVLKNTILSVTWNGKDLDQLTDQALARRFTGRSFPNCTGAFGVTNYLGSTTFSDYRLMRN